MQTLDNQLFDRLAATDTPLVVDFWAAWCGPCRALAPVFDQLARDTPTIQFATVDVDTNTGFANRFGVAAVPTVLAFRGGRVVGELRGGVTARGLRQLVEGLS